MTLNIFKTHWALASMLTSSLLIGCGGGGGAEPVSQTKIEGQGYVLSELLVQTGSSVSNNQANPLTLLAGSSYQLWLGGVDGSNTVNSWFCGQCTSAISCSSTSDNPISYAQGFTLSLSEGSTASFKEALCDPHNSSGIRIDLSTVLPGTSLILTVSLPSGKVVQKSLNVQ